MALAADRQWYVVHTYSGYEHKVKASLEERIRGLGNPDLFGRTLQVSIAGFADEIASAASLVMGQGDEAQPVVLVRGLGWTAASNPAHELVRPASEDLFR